MSEATQTEKKQAQKERKAYRAKKRKLFFKTLFSRKIVLVSAIVVLLIMNIGRMMSIGFDRPFIIGNTKVKDYCDVISTFVYRAGITNSQFARATAIGLFQSIVGLVLITGANTVSRLFDEQSIW